jgi:hypothetical protein
VTAFGCTQPNSNRERLHLHALIAPTLTTWSTTTGETAREQLLELDRWTTSRGLGQWITRVIADTQPVYRPYLQPDNAGSVRLGPVTPRGKADDPSSLVAYIVRYLLRVDAGDWLEAGDLSKAFPR